MDSELTAAQRRFLRSAARSRRCDVTIGKAGVNDSVLAHVRALLAQRELLKVRLPKSGDDRAAAAEEIAAAAGATVVDLIGRVVVLYRPKNTA